MGTKKLILFLMIALFLQSSEGLNFRRRFDRLNLSHRPHLFHGQHWLHPYLLARRNFWRYRSPWGYGHFGWPWYRRPTVYGPPIQVRPPQPTQIVCRNKTPKPPYCSGGQIVTEFVTVRKVRNSCIYDYKSRRDTPKCIKLNDKPGKCERNRNGQFYCMADDIVYTAEIDSQCNCINKPVIKPRICCCRDSRNYTICDAIRNVEERVQVDFFLDRDNNGLSCKAIEKRTSITKSFPTEYTMEVGSCNHNGYQLDINRKKIVEGCKIKTIVDRTETRQCACPTKPRITTECNGDFELVTKTFKSGLHCCECSCLCEERLESIIRKTVECPQTSIKKGECINNNRQITSTNYKLKNCICQPIIIENLEKCGTCEYKEYNRTVGPCCPCKDTETITIFYKDTDCNDKEKRYEQPCSCTDPAPSTKTYCDNGYWITATTNAVFDKDLNKCIAKTTNKLRRDKCNPKKVIIGKCGEERKYFKKITTIEEDIDEDTCKCKKTTDTKFIICECPKSQETDWICEQNENLVKRVKRYVLNFDRNICDKKIDKIDNLVNCEKPPANKIVQINECEHDKISYYMRIIDCKCKVTEVRRRVVRRCCQAPTTSEKCDKDDTLVTRQTTYKVNCDRTRCVPVVIENSRKIICNNYFIKSNSPCENGQMFTITKYFGVKQCKCVQINEQKIPIVIECNTSRPIVKSRCDGSNWILTRQSWENQNCKCIEKNSYSMKSIDCPAPRSTTSPCNYATRKVTIRTITYNIVDCKCVAIRKFHEVDCPCLREDRIEKSQCVGRKRIVNRFRFTGVKGRCRWEVIDTASEDCDCSETCIQTKCYKNQYTLTTTTSFDLVLKQFRLPVERCVKRQVTTSKDIVCPQDYTYTTPCKNFKQSVISCTHEIVNCECITKCETECVRACNCDQKNSIATKCINNNLVRIQHQYANNGHGCGCGCKKTVSNCAINTIREIIPVSCLQPTPRRICSRCTINYGHGIYKKCTIITREKTNCRCHLRSKTKFVLCRCIESTTTSFCRNNERVDIVSRYLKLHRRCILKTSETKAEIDCPRPYIITEDQACRTIYTLVYYNKERCQCVKKRRVKSNSKCCIKPIVDKACKKENWVITKQTWIQRSTGRKLFNQISDSPIETFCEHVIKKRSKVVICDKDAIITWCNTKTKRYHKIRTYFIKPNCLCLKKVSESTEPCKKCKRTKEHRGKCDQSNLDSYGYLDLTTIRYKVTERNVCKKHIRHTKELCRCPRRREREFCSKGKLVFEAISFVLRSKPLCEKQVSVKEKTIHCYNDGKPNAWRPGKIDECKSPGQYTIQHFERDQFKECSCIKMRKQKKIEICCKPCRPERKCIANRKVVITICEHAKGLKCVMVSHAISSEVECPRPIKKLIGKPVKCVQKYSRTVYINSKCHCLPKTTKRSKLVCCIPRITVKRKCEGQRWKITKTKFKLVKRKCIPHLTVRYKNLCTCKLHEETTKDRNIDEYTFERTYYRKKIVNCKFEKYVWRKETLNRKCRPWRIEKHCKNNRIWVTTKYFFKFCHFRCIPRSKRTQKYIVCKDLVLKERVSIGLCRAKDIYYKIVYKNCKCRRKIVRVDTSIEICCCHHTPYTKVRCNERGGIITTSHYTFHLRNERCIKSAKHRSVAVNCNRKDCHTSVGPCKNNTNTVTLFCMRRHKCKCIKKIVNQGNQCCKPESYQWKVVGKCNESTRIKKTKYFAFRLDGERKICRPVVIRIQRKICKCDEKRIVRECINDTIRKFTTIKFKLNEERDTCVRHAREYMSGIGCCRNKRRIGVVGQKCNRETGWGEIMAEYVQAKNCTCVKSRKVRRCPCICKVAFPTQVRSYCKDNKVVTETKTAVCHKCRVRWIVSSKSIRICNCEKIVIEKGNCFPSKDGYAISIRYNSKVQYQSINCKCVRKVIKTWKEHCECRKSRRVVKCQISQILITTFMYFNKNGTCQRLIKKNVTKIPCPSKPKVIQSKCKNNHYNIKTIYYYYGTCICLSKVCIQKCDCQCPKNTLVRRCTGKYFKELIVVTWKIKNCRCIKSEIRRKYCPKCPSYIKKTIEPCVKKGKMGFKRIILRSLSKRSDICKCLVKEHVKYRCCWCKENVKTKKFCIENNKFVTQTSKRVINKSLNKCKRIIVKTTTEAIKVPASIRKYYCNRKTGRDLIKTINFHIENCVPKPTIKKDYGRCTCDKEWKLIKRGKCLRSNRCMRTDTYIRKQLENRKCKDVKELKIERCCCIPKKTKKEYCKDNRMHYSTTTFELVNFLCPPKESIIITEIICSSRIIVEKGPCNNNGFKIIRKYRFVNRNCKCVKELFKEIRCKCKCGKQIVKYHCNKVAKVSTKTVTKYAIIRCKCAAKIDIFKTIIPCPGKTIEISKCIEIPGKDYSERTTTTITYHINDHCKCVRKTKIDKEKCCCKRMKEIKERCDNKNHVFITEISFRVLQNKECVWKGKIKKHFVCRGSVRWVLKGDSGCIADNHFGRRILTYVRQRAVGCDCKEERKSKVCNCLCRGPLQRRHCDRGTNEIVTTSYHYKLIKCKCVVTTSVTRRKNKCRQLPNITQPCRLWRNGISVIYTIHRDVILINCRCQIIPRKTWIICKCPDSFTVHKCDASKNTIVSTRTWYKYYAKKCVKQTETTFAPVPCDTVPDCTVHSKCKVRRKDRQVHKCIFRRLHNCKCKAETKLINKPCRCGSTKKLKGRCNRDTCRRIITIKKYYLRVLRNNKTRCITRVTGKPERCCCRRKPKTIIACVNNKLIETTISIIFNKNCKTCHKIVKEINKTPLCSPAKEKHRGKCNKTTTCNQLIYITERSLANCKCHISKRVRVKKCCCLKDFTKIKCLNNEINRSITHKFYLIRGKCLERFVVDNKRVLCPMESNRIIKPCCLQSRTQTREFTSYIIKNCKCIKITKRRVEECICKRPLSKEECIPSKGVFRITFTTYTLDIRRHICIESKQTSERVPYCNTKPMKICQACKVSYHCGTYRICRTTFEVRHFCHCIFQSISHFELCSCPKSTLRRRCTKNNTILKIQTDYAQITSQSKDRDFECVKKSKIVQSQIIICPKTIVRKSACIKDVIIYTKYFYVALNCVCTLRIKSYQVTCNCKKRNNVWKCVRDSQIVVIYHYSRLYCYTRHLIPRCKCIEYSKKSSLLTGCPRRYAIVDKCVGKRRRIRFVKYKVKNCKCHRIERSQSIHCEVCKKEMKYCKKIKNLGLCTQSLYLKFLCQFSCNYCEHCPKKCVTKSISACRCRKVAGIQICTRKIEILSNQHVHRKCVQQKTVKHALCSCSMDYSKSKCEQLKKLGRCKEIKVLRKCQFVCTPSCQLCQGNIRHRSCEQSGNHKATFKLVVVSFKRHCDSCVAQITVTHSGKCLVCSRVQRFEVTSCVRNTRFIIRHYVKKEGRVCANKESRIIFSCKGCCPGTKTKIGECKNGRRTVVTVFWANVNHCCKKQTVTNVYSCNRRCGTVSQILTQCVNNKRMAVKVWKSGRNCESHSAYEIRSCIPIPN